MPDFLPGKILQCGKYFSDNYVHNTNFFIDEKWKAVRQLITPAYTSAKLKQMTGPIISSITDYTAAVKSQIEDNNGKLENYILRE